MKFLKLKNLLFGLIAFFAIAIVMTSCEQEALNKLPEGVAIENSQLNAGAGHDCAGECYVEPDYVTTITTRLPFAETETEVSVGIKDGIAYYEGDIILGKLSDLQLRGVARDNLRWTNSTIPYVIGTGFTDAEITKINNAAANITANTNLCVIPRTSEANFVNFLSVASGCSSAVGMQGDDQNIRLSPTCPFGTVIHEILHAAGIWHEQSREDRDEFITINFDNITVGREGNFNRQVANATDFGAYDYGSVMHYGAFGFSRNGLPTITTIPSGIPIGQRDGLSAGDIATINTIYPTACGGGGANSLSWNPTPTSISNGNNQVTLDYSINQNGILLVQVFNPSWELIGQVYENVSSGTRTSTLTLPASNPSATNNHLQAKLLNTGWGDIGVQALYEKLPSGATPPPPTGGNSLSWNPTPTNISNGNNQVTLNYSIDQSGILLVQVFNSSWDLVGQVYEDVSSGARQSTLTLSASGLSGSNNHLQAKLLNSGWGDIGVEQLYVNLP